jgi:hypothetical protein
VHNRAGGERFGDPSRDDAADSAEEKDVLIEVIEHWGSRVEGGLRGRTCITPTPDQPVTWGLAANHLVTYQRVGCSASGVDARANTTSNDPCDV